MPTTTDMQGLFPGPATSLPNGANVGTIGATSPGVVIAGVQNGGAAAAGQVGEVISAGQSTYTNFTTTGTYQQCVTITLTPGDWDLSASLTLAANGATLTTGGNTIVAVSTTTASAAGAVEGKNLVYIDQNLVTGNNQTTFLRYPIIVSASTPIFLNAQSAFTLGNPQFVCFFWARRMR